jgi:uncharacterized protein YidB (DUF937 family)
VIDVTKVAQQAGEARAGTAFAHVGSRGDLDFGEGFMDMTAVTNLLKQHGPALASAAVGLMGSKSGSASGLASVVEGFTQKGLGQQASSWVGTGENQPVSADQVKSALGDQQVTKVAEQAGVSKGEAASGLAGMLPQLINQLTPDGKIPAADQLQGLLSQIKL